MKPILVLILLLAASLAHADKPTLAISPVNVSPAIDMTALQGEAKVALSRVVDALPAQLVDAFGQTGKFNVISRTDLPPVIEEQILGQSGNVSAASSARQGEIEGASYVLVVGLIDFNLFAESARFVAISRDQRRAQLTLTAVARIYDSTTGALLASAIDGVTERDFQQYFAFADREGDLEQLIYTQAAGALARELVVSLVNDLFPAKVVAKTGDQITINRGHATEFNPQGARLAIFAIGEEMTDPDTGESLGKEEIYLGSAVIIRMDERTSIAKLGEDLGVERGHIVRVAQ